MPGDILPRENALSDEFKVSRPVMRKAIKACGVTFAASMLDRVIEERAKGDPGVAELGPFIRLFDGTFKLDDLR